VRVGPHGKEKMMTHHVTGVILAAGQSRRMGRPKALLSAGDGDTFLSVLIRTLTAGGTGDVLVVTRPADVALGREIARASGAGRVRQVENPAAERGGQLSSIIAALGAVDARAEAILIVPVDMPLVRPSTVRRLIEACRNAQAPILRAVCGGRHGHPVIFTRDVFEDLRRAAPAVGARAVVRARGAVDVEVDDPGVLEDVDTPEDYEHHFGRPPSA
jgi:molybdenum cofactor cytidylyltransferase